ncbi:PA14 domain-containing protein [Okeania hirsuta]|nr:PA14 domain-containing protein [Okeania hirsuta]
MISPIRYLNEKIRSLISIGEQGSPATNMGPNDFSIRWSGFVDIPTTGTYTFTTNTDDGLRLWVNGKMILDFWVPQAPTERAASIDLTGGERVAIEMDYYELGGGAVAQLLWEGPWHCETDHTECKPFSLPINPPATI